MDLNFLILKTGQREFSLVHSIGIAHTECKDTYMILLKVNALVLRQHFSHVKYSPLALGVVYNKHSVKQLLNCCSPSHNPLLLRSYINMDTNNHHKGSEVRDEY